MRLFFKGEVKVVYSFSTKEYELVLGFCPKVPLDWERKKNIKLRVKPKDGEKKEKKKKGFSLKR